MEAAGKPCDGIIHRFGLQRTRLLDPRGRLPFGKHVALLERAAEELDDELFGMRCGAGTQLREFGLYAYIALNSPKVGASLLNMRRYLRVVNEGAEFEITAEDDELVAIVYRITDMAAMGSRQQTEFGIASSRPIATQLAGRDLTPAWIEFVHGPPANGAEARRLLGASIRYEMPRNAVVVPRWWLDLPIEQADSDLLRILKEYADHILDERAQSPDLVGQLQHWIIKRLSSGTFAAEAAARELGMSVRTLSRKLAAYHTSYGQIVDDLRENLAAKYVTDPSMQLTQIAYLLGYSDSTSFSKAFRQWYGCAPSRFRKQQEQVAA
jgi:AraC-like DNA-binding protein